MFLEKCNSYYSEKTGVVFDLNSYDIYQDVESKEIVLDNINKPEYYQKNYKSSDVEVVRIHISNICNLTCDYCYASGGSYGMKEAIVDVRDAELFAKKIIDKFPNLGTINFFGGEPLMAKESVEIMSRYIDEIRPNTKFYVNTNGTILDESLIKLFKDLDFALTISIDGFKKVHDKYRTYKDGSGSFDVIKKNISTLRNAGFNQYGLQCTVTNEFLKENNKDEIEAYLLKTFNPKWVAINNVMTDDQELEVQDYKKNISDVGHDVKKFFKNLEENNFIEDTLGRVIISSFLSKDNKFQDEFCSAGKKMISIDYNGTIYPCQLFVGSSEFEMGSIFKEETVQLTTPFLESVKKNKFSECQNCISKSFCRACPKLFSKTPKVADLKIDCEYSRKYTEGIFEEISNYIVQNKFDIFNDKFKEVHEQDY